MDSPDDSALPGMAGLRTGALPFASPATYGLSQSAARGSTHGHTQPRSQAQSLTPAFALARTHGREHDGRVSDSMFHTAPGPTTSTPGVRVLPFRMTPARDQDAHDGGRAVRSTLGADKPVVDPSRRDGARQDDVGLSRYTPSRATGTALMNGADATPQDEEGMLPGMGDMLRAAARAPSARAPESSPPESEWTRPVPARRSRDRTVGHRGVTWKSDTVGPQEQVERTDAQGQAYTPAQALPTRTTSGGAVQGVSAHTDAHEDMHAAAAATMMTPFTPSAPLLAVRDLARDAPDSAASGMRRSARRSTGVRSRAREYASEANADEVRTVEGPKLPDGTTSIFRPLPSKRRHWCSRLFGYLCGC